MIYANVVLDPTAKPPGAVVAGLGQVADMTAGLLRHALRHALLAFSVADVGNASASDQTGSP